MLFWSKKQCKRFFEKNLITRDINFFEKSFVFRDGVVVVVYYPD